MSELDELTLAKFSKHLDTFAEQNRMLMSKLFEVLPPAQWLKFSLEFRQKYWPESVTPDNWTNLKIIYPELFMEKSGK